MTETALREQVSRCLELRDQNALASITAVLIYPMNALAEDQLERLLGELLWTKLRRARGGTSASPVGSGPKTSRFVFCLATLQ